MRVGFLWWCVSSLNLWVGTLSNLWGLHWFHCCECILDRYERWKSFPCTLSWCVPHNSFDHEKNNGTIPCCLPFLYTCLNYQIFKAYHWIKEKTNDKWTQTLVILNEKSIFWYAGKLNVEEIIFSCGELPNFPIIGSKGCISYNPTLALRKYGYPIIEKLDDEALIGLILHDMSVDDPIMMQRIIQEWNKVNTKWHEFGKKKCVFEEPYC